MICLRCGYCCKNYVVVIADNPDLPISETNVTTHIGDNKPCKHLVGDKPGKYLCAVHNKTWYHETPCYDYTQVESTHNTPCRMGVYIMKKSKLT